MQNMTDLRTILMNRLLTTPEEEQEKMAYLAEIAKRERQHALVIERLEEELKETVEDKDEAVCVQHVQDSRMSMCMCI